jgi:hypothetical protein
MTKKGYNVFVAYSDPAANEVGTVYQASNWLYCGMTRPKKRFRTLPVIRERLLLVSFGSA